MLTSKNKIIGYRRTFAEVDLGAISHNVKEIVRLKSPNIKHVFAVVKANGYGHGALEVARVALDSGATALAVSSLDEAVFLRTEGIVKPTILVMGNVVVDDMHIAQRHNISITIHTHEDALILNQINKSDGLKVHLKINSGMNRLGISDQREVREIVDLFNNNSSLELEGIFTHFAVADGEIDNQSHLNQIKSFKHLTSEIDLSTFKIVHLANSAAHTMQSPISFQNGIRIGIIMYGLKPNRSLGVRMEPKQAMSLYSYVSQINNIIADDKVGYGLEYQAQNRQKIAVVAIGYADGYIRKNKNSFVFIKNKKFKVIGRVCMDQIMVLVDGTVKAGDVVELFGPNISIDEVAKANQTINYEVTCLITNRVPRIYKG